MHITPVHEAADLSVTGVTFITHFMFSAFFSIIYNSCNTFSKRQSLFFFPVKLRAGFSPLPRNSCSRLPRAAWPKDRGSTKTPPSHFHQQNRCKQSLGTPEGTGKHRHSVDIEKTHLCRDWGCAVCALLSPRVMPASIPHKYSAWCFHNKQPKGQSGHPKAGLSAAQSTGCATTRCKWPSNPWSRNKII